MASFPASVKSFTTKLDGAGNPVNAAHINDLQDEVNAVEDGYVNGTARLNSSNSTLARLSVTGGSTFAVRPVAPPPDIAYVWRDSTYAAGSSANSTFTWTAQNFVTNSSMHSTATNPDRLTPQSTGVYLATLSLTYSAPSIASQIRGNISDSTGAISGQDEAAISAAAGILQVQAYKRFDALGGWVTAQFVNVAGGSTFSISSGIANTWFVLQKL